MRPRHLLFVLLGLPVLVSATEPRRIVLPPEKAQLVESPLPGYALANAFCFTCHSVDYLRTQPPATPRAWWKTSVVKMQKTFGAPIPDSAVEPLVDYLVKTYGAERAPATPRAEPPAKARN